MSRDRTLNLVIAGLLILSLGLVWVTIAIIQPAGDASSGGPPAGTDDAVFTFNQGLEPRTLDPAAITDTHSAFIAGSLFEGLLVWNAAGDALEPGIASSYEVSDDGRQYTFTLREDAIWTNGDPVAAADFVVAWRRLLNPDLGSPYASLLYPIKGARELHRGLVRDAGVLAVEARDRHTLLVGLLHPTPWFPAIVAHTVTAPINPRAVKRHGYAWTEPENIVVNGPFTLESWTPGHELVLARNRYYHSVEEVRLAGVIARVDMGPERVVEMYESGQIMWTGRATGALPLDQLVDLAKRPDAHVQAQLGTSWYYLNTSEPPLSDLRVRQALHLSLDRKALGSILGPSGLATSGYVPPGMGDYRYPAPRSYDPQGARALLAEAGYPGGEGMPPLELAVDARNLQEQVAAWVAESWRRELGIEVNLFARRWAAHWEAVEQGNFQVARGGWLGDYPDPSTFLDLFLSDNELNRSQWGSASYDELVREAGRTVDPASRRRLLSAAERQLVQQLPAIPVFHFSSVSLVSPRVGGYVDNPLDMHLLRYISLD
jgi:oligopeptide transport system substrate-binding protein